MNADRWKQIDQLLDAVLELPETQREAFLSAKCNGDDELKIEVLSLLEAQKETGGFLENSAMNLMAKEIAGDQTTVVDFSILGRELGNYRIERPLGAGGMGEVFLAHDAKLNRKVALKILPAEFILDAERVKRFEREAKAISALNHPNIVTIYDFGQLDGINFIVTEYIEGKTVRELLAANMSLKEMLSIVSQTCEALAAAHASGIIHRDIKPENIMVRPDGYVKVLDFGLAKLKPQSDSIHISLTNYTQKGMIIGTLAYMSPEQVSDENVGHRTDLWSLGVVFYEMLCGVNPFKGENRQATLNAILNINPPPVSVANQSLPAELDRILEKALEKEADVSYQSASDLRADLRRVRREIDSSPSLRTGSAGTERRIPEAKKGGNYFVPAFGILTLVVTGFSIWFFVFRSNHVSATDWSKATNVQLTEQQGTEFYPALSPDGKSFVYAADAAGNFDIFVQRVGGKNPINLTKDSSADDTQPAFSPNGEQIAFRSEREPKGIYVMGESGENLRRVADFGFQPSWSPGGKEIVVGTFGPAAPNVRQGLNNGLWIINIETGGKRKIIKKEATFPSWSPNGKRIAYWFYPGSLGRRDIATIPVEGGEPVVITTDFGRSNWNPVWSPDGGFLYFVSDKGGNINFWRVAINETTGEALSAPEPVNTPSKYSRHLNFSRDGKRMIYAQTDSQSNIQGIEFDSKAEKTVGEWFWITRGDREIVRAELSPDGKQFVMRQTRRTQDDIVVVNRDGTNWRDVTNDAPFDRYPRWSADGKQIAFASDRNNGYEIWICNSDGSNLRQVSFQYTHQNGSSFATWAPDGKSLIYTNNFQPYLLDLTKTWQEQQAPQKVLIAEPDRNFVGWDWSPDGKKLLGTLPLGERAIAVYSFETKLLERIVEDIDSGNVIPSWLDDSRRFVFAKDNRIFLTDSVTKKTKEIHSRQPEQIRSPFVSRDGRLLYYVMHFNESDIWLLDVSQNP
jgi:serine/threonine protein kinase